jgi:serpin B
MHRKILLVLPLLAMLASATAVAQFADTEEPSEDALIPVPIEIDDKARTAVTGVNKFSLDLYRQTLNQNENHFISPASVSVAMSLAYRASGGTTAQQMRDVLSYTASPTEYLQATASLLKAMNFKKAGRELATANSIWIDRSVILRPDYLADTQNLVGSAVEQADFRGNPDDARKTINRWVEIQTHDRIKDLLAQPHVTAATRSILVNTIYWKANWALPFAKSATRKEPFREQSGKKVKIDLMHQQANFQAIEHRGTKAILLPYQGGELEMAVFLPKSANGLPRFERELSPEQLDEWFARLAEAPARNTVLTLPKMHLQWGKDLVPEFKRMGMTAPFDFDADFSAITTPADKGTLAIGAIVHKTYLDVDEEGSEAAAATAVDMVMVTSGRRKPAPPPPPFVFRADHPFLFVLRDRRTGLICFMGRFVAVTGAA